MPERSPIVVIGAGGHGKVVIDTLRAAGGYKVVGVVDSAPNSGPICGLPVLGDDSILATLRSQGIEAAFIAIGDNRLRQKLAENATQVGFTLPAAVHPSAVVSSEATLGAGVYVGPLAIINACARIADMVIVNSGAIIEHDCVVETAAHVAPGCALSGGVRVGARTLVGVGTAVRPRVTIGEDVVVGAGSVVVTDISDSTVVVGAPAKLLRLASHRR